MNGEVQLKEFKYGNRTLLLYVPIENYVQETYHLCKQENPQTPFPYWAKLWPSALALADFLNEHTEYVKNKVVLELAAGLGLPSFVAAMQASFVCASDYLQDAIDVIERSRKANEMNNVDCRVLNWHSLPADLTTDVLLMSDVNYDPGEFEQLLVVFKIFLSKGTTIILATPQRLMAKSFIEELMNYIIVQEQTKIEDTNISIFVLQDK